MARQTGTVGMGRVDVSGLGTMMDPIMKGMDLQQQAENQRQDRYGKSLLATADMLDRQRQYALQQEANRRANEALGIQKAQEGRAVIKDARDIAGQQALGQYQQELDVLGQNIIPEKEGLAIGEAFAAGKIKNTQGAVDAAIAKYNANPRAQMQVLQTAAMPEGEYDPAHLLDARQKKVDTLHGDAKQLDQNAFTIDRDVKNFANQLTLAQKQHEYTIAAKDYETPWEKRSREDARKLFAVQDEVNKLDTVEGKRQVEQGNLAIAKYESMMNAPGVSKEDKVRYQTNIDAIVKGINTLSGMKVPNPDRPKQAQEILRNAYDPFSLTKDYISTSKAQKEINTPTKSEDTTEMKNLKYLKSIGVSDTKAQKIVFDISNGSDKTRGLSESSMNLLKEVAGGSNIGGTGYLDLANKVDRYSAKVKYKKLGKDVIARTVAGISDNWGTDSASDSRIEEELNKILKGIGSEEE